MLIFNQSFSRLLSVQDLAILTPLGPKSCYPTPSGPKKMPKYLVLKCKKKFPASSAPEKYAYVPIFSLFIVVLRNNFSLKHLKNLTPYNQFSFFISFFKKQFFGKFAKIF